MLLRPELAVHVTAQHVMRTGLANASMDLETLYADIFASLSRMTVDGLWVVDCDGNAFRTLHADLCRDVCRMISVPPPFTGDLKGAKAVHGKTLVIEERSDEGACVHSKDAVALHVYGRLGMQVELVATGERCFVTDDTPRCRWYWKV